jgi:hypothetical protein
VCGTSWQPQIFNVGPMWSFDWQRFVQEEPIFPPALSVFPHIVWAYNGGGKEVYMSIRTPTAPMTPTG